MSLQSFPPPGQPAITGPGGALVTCPAAGLTDTGAMQFGSNCMSVHIGRFQPTQQGASIVTPGTQNTEQTINPLQQIATQVNNESVLGIILAAAALVILYKMVHH